LYEPICYSYSAFNPADLTADATSRNCSKVIFNWLKPNWQKMNA